jgi:aminoglycoside 6'-N-acetyltransferase I
MIRPYVKADLDACAHLLIESYNGSPWNDVWTVEKASSYLREFAEVRRFVGFTVWKGQELAGVTFCHEQTWWEADELYVDEFYISPKLRHQGFGTELIQELENHCRQKRLGAIVFLTNNDMPAANFYRKNGFRQGEHQIFMCKDLK